MKSYLLVADVLGFSNIVSNLDHNDLSLRIETWTSLVEEVRQEKDIKHIQLISDTIFVQEEDSEDGLKRLFQFSKLLLERGTENYFPIRGAITHGEVSWGEDLIYGEAVIEAHHLERSLDWIGIACKEQFIDIPWLPWSWDLACRYPVPLKKGSMTWFPGIIWNIPDELALFEKSTDEGLMKDEYEKVRWEHFSKVMNTVIFSEYIYHAKREELDPSKFHYHLPSHFNFTYFHRGENDNRI